MALRVSPRLGAIPRYVPGMSTAEALARHGVEDAVKLSSNESPFGPLPGVEEAVAGVAAGLNRYPDGRAGALRARIADLHGVGDDQVIVGNGSGEIILMAGQALLDPGTTVVYPDPSFALYPHIAHAAGAEGVAVPLDRAGRNDLAAMAAYVDERTRLVVVCSPNNPTGGYVPAAAVERLLDEIPSDVGVLVDEAYHDFVSEVDRGRVMSMARERPNLLVTRTFSKAFGLSGARVGYGAGSPRWVDAIDRVRPPFHVGAAGQAAALAALGALTELDARVRTLTAERGRVQDALRDAGVAFTPSQANFILVGPFAPDAFAAPVHEELLRRGVIVRDGDALGAPGCIRVTVGTAQDNDRFLHALAAARGARQLQDNPRAAV
jgi:histidinol-phosphate aminotransferase